MLLGFLVLLLVAGATVTFFKTRDEPGESARQGTQARGEQTDRQSADMMLSSPRESAASSSRPPNRDEPAAASPTVRITLTGVPRNATVMFGDTPVSSKTFRTPRQSHAESLSVQSPGYRTFRREVIPDEDQTITVGMVALGSHAGRASNRPAPKPKLKKKRRPKYQPAEPSSGFIQGKRKTEIAEAFE